MNLDDMKVPTTSYRAPLCKFIKTQRHISKKNICEKSTYMEKGTYQIL